MKKKSKNQEIDQQLLAYHLQHLYYCLEKC